MTHSAINDLHVKSNRLMLQSVYASARGEFGNRVAGLKLTQNDEQPHRFDIDLVDADQIDITFGESHVPLSEMSWSGSGDPQADAAFERFADVLQDQIEYFSLYPTRQPLAGGVEVNEGRSIIFMADCATLRPGTLRS